MKLLVTDYDNTYELHYSHTDNTAILKRNISSLKKFMKSDLLCIATGRHFDAIFKTLIENNIDFNYLIANNGAELYDRDYKLLYCNPINESDLNVVNKLDKKNDVYYRTPNNSNLITSINIYFNEYDEFINVKNYLDMNLKMSSVEYKFPKIKIINKNCEKLKAINIIKRIENIFNNDIYTIGDDVNDISMIKEYNGYSLNTANIETKKVASKLYDELNQLVEEIITKV